MLAHQRQNQVQVVLLVEPALPDMAARFAGRLRDRAGHDEVGVAPLHQTGRLQATVLVATYPLTLLNPVKSITCLRSRSVRSINSRV